jgi:hypothetical protein
MKQTAVEWLWDNWKDKCNSFEELVSLFKQAKEMEKEQIIDAYQFGDGEQYYNETFKSE